MDNQPLNRIRTLDDLFVAMSNDLIKFQQMECGDSRSKIQDIPEDVRHRTIQNIRTYLRTGEHHKFCFEVDGNENGIYSILNWGNVSKDAILDHLCRLLKTVIDKMDGHKTTGSNDNWPQIVKLVDELIILTAQRNGRK